MIPKHIIHLLSGGMDSVTLLYDLVKQGNEVHCLLFDYKQKHSQELLFAKLHCNKLGLMFTTYNLPELGINDNYVIPNRNAIFISLAVNLAIQEKADGVTIAINENDATSFKDCSVEFISDIQKSIYSAGNLIEIYTPYLFIPKSKIADIAKTHGLNLSDFWSCYNGGKTECGKCLACINLKKAWQHDDIDPQR